MRIRCVQATYRHGAEQAGLASPQCCQLVLGGEQDYQRPPPALKLVALSSLWRLFFACLISTFSPLCTNADTMDALHRIALLLSVRLLAAQLPIISTLGLLAPGDPTPLQARGVDMNDLKPRNRRANGEQRGFSAHGVACIRVR
jgi:hypothetical protein